MGIDHLPSAALLLIDDAPRTPIFNTDPIALHLRRARLANIGHAIVYVPRLSPALLTITEALRGEGMTIDLARNIAEVADYVHPDDVVLLLAPSTIVSAGELAKLASHASPALLCVSDEPANAAYELIDPTARWSGYARLDGAMLRQTAVALGDWDFASTLLRRAVQDGATRIMLDPEAAGAALLPISDVANARAAARRLVASARGEPDGCGDYWVSLPCARWVVHRATDVGRLHWLQTGSAIVAGGALASAAMGSVAASLLLIVTLTIVASAGRIASAIGAASASVGGWLRHVRAAAPSLVILATGVTLMGRSAQWGYGILAVVIIGTLLLRRRLPGDTAAFVSSQADDCSIALILAAGVAADVPALAMLACAVHSALSLARVVQRGLARP